MDPENFLEETDVIPLVLALNKFAIDVNAPDTRQDVLTSAGIDPSF